MAEPHEETVGDVADVLSHAKEAPIMQRDIVTGNGELLASDSLAEFAGKEKEDSTLSSSAPAPELTGVPSETENGEHAIPSEEPQEDGTTDKKAIAATAPSKAEEEGPISEEAERVPAADGIPETAEKARSEEIPAFVGDKEVEVKATPEFAHTAEPEPPRVAEEECTKPVETPPTHVGEIEAPESSQTDESETQVGEVEAPKSSQTNELETQVGEVDVPKSSETNEPEVQGGEAEAPKFSDTGEKEVGEQEKADDASVVAGDSILKTVSVTEADAVEPQITEDNTPKSSEVVQPEASEVVVNEKQRDVVGSTEEPQAEVISKEENSAAGPGESIPIDEKEAEEPMKVEEASHGEVLTPAPSPVEQEQPSTEPAEPPKPTSFWGVVLKHVQPNGKSALESQSNEEDGTSVLSSNAQDSNDVDKSPEEAHEKEPVTPLVTDVEEQARTRGHAAASDVSEEKEGQTGVEEAPKAVTESETTPNDISPKELEEVSDHVELPENAATETPESVEQDRVNDSPKEADMPTSAAEENQNPSFSSEMSKEIPGNVSEETLPEPSEMTAGSTEEPKDIPSTIAQEQTPGRAGQDTSEQLTQETSKEAEPEEGTSLPVEKGAVEGKEAREDISGLEKQPSLSVYIPKQEEAAAAAEGYTAEETTPRGTPLMQRVEQLEQKLVQLDSRQSPRSDLTSTEHSTPRSSIDRPIRHSTRHVLEETGSKGTLIDRVAALEQKLAYYLNLHATSPSNGHSTPTTTVTEDLATEPDSKPAESLTRDLSPPAAEGDKTPQPANEETSKAAQDKPATEEKFPEDLPAQTEGVAPSRSTSLNAQKTKAKAGAGKLKGFITGCFSPKNGKSGSTST